MRRSFILFGLLCSLTGDPVICAVGAAIRQAAPPPQYYAPQQPAAQQMCQTQCWEVMRGRLQCNQVCQ